MTTAEHTELRPLTEEEVAFASGSGSGVIICADGSVHCDVYTIPPAVLCYYAL